MVTKVTVNLPNETIDSLRHLAAMEGTTLTQAFVLAIKRQKFLDDEIARGNKVLLMSPEPFIPVLFDPFHGRKFREVTFK